MRHHVRRALSILLPPSEIFAIDALNVEKSDAVRRKWQGEREDDLPAHEVAIGNRAIVRYGFGAALVSVDVSLVQLSWCLSDGACVMSNSIRC